MSIIKHKTRGSLVVISGPSGAGKGTICNELIKDKNIWFSISMTSREPREFEVDGREYFFVSKEEFEEKIEDDDFLEYAIVHSGQYYGTPKSKITEKLEDGYDVILDIDIQGALKINNLIPDAIFIFIVPPTMEILKERLIKRNTESSEKILERFKTAYKEINEVKMYNYVVVNDVLEDTILKVKSILMSEKCRVDRIEQVDLYNDEEIIHEALVDFNV